MLRWVVRAGLIRIVGRRVIPVLLVYDAVQLVRAVRRRTAGKGSTDPVEERPPRS